MNKTSGKPGAASEYYPNQQGNEQRSVYIGAPAAGKSVVIGNHDGQKGQKGPTTGQSTYVTGTTGPTSTYIGGQQAAKPAGGFGTQPDISSKAGSVATAHPSTTVSQANRQYSTLGPNSGAAGGATTKPTTFLSAPSTTLRPASGMTSFFTVPQPAGQGQKSGVAAPTSQVQTAVPITNQPKVDGPSFFAVPGAAGQGQKSGVAAPTSQVHTAVPITNQPKVDGPSFFAIPGAAGQGQKSGVAAPTSQVQTAVPITNQPKVDGPSFFALPGAAGTANEKDAASTKVSMTSNSMGHTYTQLPAPQTCVGVTGASTAVGFLPVLDLLVGVDTVGFEKQADTFDFLLGSQRGNHYSLMIATGQKIFSALEEFTNAEFKCAPGERKFVVHMFDNSKKEIFRLNRPNALAPIGGTIEVESPPGNKILTCVRLQNDYQVVDFANKPIFNVAKELNSIAKSPKDTPFVVRDLNGVQVGQITKKPQGTFKEMFSDSGAFIITFNASMETIQKASIIGTTFLINYLEHEKSQTTTPVAPRTASAPPS